MNWTDAKKANDKISYDHVTCSTPLGEMLITWKSWKRNPSYDVELIDKNGRDTWIGVEYGLEDAKRVAYNYLLAIHTELSIYLLQE